MALYRAAIDRSQLADAMRQVSAWLGMPHHQLTAMHSDGRFLPDLNVASRDDMAHWGARYNEQFAGRDPREVGAQQDRLFIDEEWFDDAYADRSDFYQEWLRPMEARRHIGLRLQATDGKLLGLAVLADIRQQRLDEEQLRRCRMLEPHLRTAFDMMLRVSDLEAQAARGQAAVDAADDGVVILADGDTITFANRRGESMLRNGRIVAMQGRRLVARGKAGTHLAQALARVRRTQRAMSVRLRDSGDQDGVSRECFVVVRPMLPAAAPMASGTAPVLGNELLLLITAPGRQRTSTAQQLMQWFDLTPAEARLAHGLLSGLSVAAYCSHHGVTDATARTQLKALFHKTGTERQPDLMRLLASLPSAR